MPSLPNVVDFAAAYDRLQTLPAGLGNKAFSVVAGLFVPHAARMGFNVDHLTKRSIAVTMPDKRANRNHLQSLHAMALAHLGEFTTGLLLLYAVSSDGYRTILVKYEIEYLHKARGPITARATLELPKAKGKGKTKSLDKKDVKVVAELSDKKGTVVARALVTWRVGKIPS
jgi:acyl-coenzyme A thioesterase PaaI-like protein